MRLDDWIAQGMHGAMAYLERQAPRRRDPALVLEGIRSIIVVAFNYYSDERHSQDPLHGRISRYAWGDDYHEIVKARLKRLRSFVEAEAPGAHCLEYVDTGPIMEKVWGAQSALGWAGKHSNLITREQGSWFFIGVILATIELEHDEPEKDFCGTCSRCISACPTGAIVAPYVVDARLCISYLTIELRGPIPRPLRPLIGNRIFGCDDCQDVCPWNRFAVSTPEREFAPRPGSLVPELASLVTLTREEFNRRFRQSPVLRARRDGFVRNVAVALGNSRSEKAVGPLEQALHDSSALVRSHAAWGLGRIGSARALDILGGALEFERNCEVREEIELALRPQSELGSPDADRILPARSPHT
jgi:epoxyqueuosine reductase